jgi:hypothetical protein
MPRAGMSWLSGPEKLHRVGSCRRPCARYAGHAPGCPCQL